MTIQNTNEPDEMVKEPYKEYTIELELRVLESGRCGLVGAIVKGVGSNQSKVGFTDGLDFPTKEKAQEHGIRAGKKRIDRGFDS